MVVAWPSSDERGLVLACLVGSNWRELIVVQYIIDP